MQRVKIGEKGVQNENSETAVVADRVTLSSFRNYRSISLRLSPGFNVLSGPNAQGKTNFLEAIALISTTRMLRGQRDAEAILEGELKGSVELQLADCGTTLGIELTRGAKKRATINGMGLPRASDLIGRLPAVCMTSVDMEIARGEPADRRMFLDLELSSLFPNYLRHLTAYKRALEQRNALLRQNTGWLPPEMFEPWEAQLAEHGIPLRQARQAYVARLEPVARQIHSEMGQGEALSLVYGPKDDSQDTEALHAALEASRGNDGLRGGTSVGPHRDDLQIMIGGRDARLFGSQGQQRTSVISVKLGSLEIAREELGLPPLLLLDDILSDLDERRRALLVEIVLARAGQAVLTCTEASAAGGKILNQAAVFEVKAGEIRAL